MHATLENLVFRFLNIPLKDFARQNPLVVLGSAVALASFAAGVYYAVKALHNAFSQQPAGPAPAVNAAALGALLPPPPQVNFCPQIRELLNQLFANTPYSVDSLPVYPTILDVEKRENFDKSLISSPVIKALTSDGRVLIGIRVSCRWNEKNMEELVPKVFKDKAQELILDEVIVIGQYFSDRMLVWDQTNRGGTSFLHPNFFDWQFADEHGMVSHQDGNFQNLKKLLQTGRATDLNGLVWKLGSLAAL